MPDPIPIGFIKITEAFQLFLKRTHPDCKLLQPVSVKGAEYEDLSEDLDQERTEFSREFMSPIYDSQVQLMYRQPGSEQLLRFPADEVSAAAKSDRDADFIRDELSFLKPNVLVKCNGRTPIVHEATYIEWLDKYHPLRELQKRRPNPGEVEQDYQEFKLHLKRDPSREEARVWRDRLAYHVTQDRVEALRKGKQNGVIKPGPKASNS